MKTPVCLICGTSKEPNLSDDFREKLVFGGSENNANLNKQLWNVFIVRKLLQVPVNLCQGILRECHGRRNPSGWFVVCEPCSELAEEGWRLHREILRLEAKLRRVGRRVREKIGEGEKREGTRVEKKIWRWLREGEPPRSPLVKREVTSPERQEEDGGDGEDEWDGSERVKWEEEVLVEPVIKIEEIEVNLEDTRELTSGGSSSEITSESEEEDWKPTRKKRRCIRKKVAKKTGEEKEETRNNEEDFGDGRKRKTASMKTRSKNSVRKAKSSLRAKRSDAGRRRGSYQRKKCVQCAKCPATFRNEAELVPHTKLHERCDQAGNEFCCKTCGYPCETDRSLRQHSSLKHELQKYICDVCGYEAPRKGRLARHKKLHMNMVDAKTYLCDICQEKFSNYISFTRHQRKEHAEALNINLFKCDKCPSAYTTNKMLQDHILHVHERNSKWCCDICGKGLLSEKNLKEHLETHEHRERSEICWVCGVDFLNNRSLREHVRKFHPTQHNTKYAKSHPQKEEPEKEYKCLYCPFTSPFRLVVMRHRKTHREVFRHLCEICSNEYSSLASLVLHKKIAHGDGKAIVQCTWCKKSFAHKHYLQNHLPRCKMRPPDVVLPKSKKPFRDSLLVTPPETQDIKSDLESTSKGVPPPPPKIKKEKGPVSLEVTSKSILCKYCKGYSTDNRGKMYDHVMKVHKDELEFKFSCDLCNVKYTTKPSLNRHVAIHHSEGNMMACQYCQKVFRHWSLLRLHYKHSCKSMPAGAPIPEAPRKEIEGKEKEKKGKGDKFRVPRIRGKKGRKGKAPEGQGYYGQSDSLEGAVMEGSSSQFSSEMQQPSTSSSSPSFLGVYGEQGEGGTGGILGAAMQMFSGYNTPGSAGPSGHRAWW